MDLLTWLTWELLGKTHKSILLQETTFCTFGGRGLHKNVSQILAIINFFKQRNYRKDLVSKEEYYINVCTDVESIIKTDVPELRRRWFSESNDDIGKPLFVTVSKKGVVFFTDNYSKSIFFYRQNPMPVNSFALVKHLMEMHC